MKFRILPLERRILLDAAAIVDIVDQASDDTEVNDFESLDVGSALAPPNGEGEAGADAPKVLLVSSEIEGYEELSKASTAEVVIVYDAETATLEDLITQIKEGLGDRVASTIAFATHGAKASLDLTSNEQITLNSLASEASHQDFWNDLGALVEPGGRIDFLACDLAGNQAGLALIQQIENLAQVDVAASDDLTGNTGDWFLEKGGIDALNFYFDPMLISYWEGSLVDPGIVEGMVWNDLDQDGIFDGSSEGVQAEVLLFDDNDNQIDSQNTVNGFFSFSVDPNFEGHIEVVLDDGTGSFDANADVDASGESPEFVLDGIEGISLDVLINYDNDVSGTLFVDTNQDGLKDSGEPFAEGIVIHLLDIDGDFLRETITDSNGFYEFDNILPGSYTVDVLAKTTAFSVDNDIGPLGEVDFTLAGDESLQFDAGIVLNRLGGFVWLEDVIDGIRSGEDQLEGVTVNLFDISDGQVLIDSTTTGVNGFYEFTNLVDGAYLVQVVNANPDLAFTLQDQGGLDNFDSDVNLQGEVVVNLTGNRINIGAGLARIFDASGTVTFQDIPERFRVVELTRESDPSFFLSTFTNPLGDYLFSGIYAFDDYIVTAPPQGEDNFVIGEGFNQISFDLDQDLDDLDINLRFNQSIALTIWRDFYDLIETPDGDLNLTGGSPDTLFIGEITVNLYQTDLGSFNPLSPPPIFSQIIGLDDGTALFEFLPDGDYVVEVLLPDDLSFTSLSTTEGDIVDNNIDPATGLIGVTINNNSFDFGVALVENFNKVEGTVWHDADTDGGIDPSESLLEGIAVNLRDAFDTVIDTTVTDSFGRYFFLLSSSFDGSVEIIGPPGASYGINGSSGIDATGIGDFSFILNQTDVDDLLFATEIQAPIFFTNEISGFIFEDDGNGTLDIGEEFFFNGGVQLLNSEGVVIDQIFFPVTPSEIPDGTEGMYLFDNLLPGDYTIRIFHNRLATYYVPVGPDNDFNSDGEFEVLGLTSTQLVEADGALSITSVTGRVFEDVNGNGIFEIGTDLGLGEVLVTITDRSGNTFVDTTNPDGTFAIEGAPLGTYILSTDYFNVPIFNGETFEPTRFSITVQDAGVDDTIDSDVNQATGDVEIVLTDVVTDLGIGLRGPVMVSGTLFQDDDGNTLFGLTEFPIPNVEILFLNIDDFSLSVMAETNASGQFLAELLPEGTYVTIIDPSLDTVPFVYENSNTFAPFTVNADLDLGDIGLIPVSDPSSFRDIEGTIWEDEYQDLVGGEGTAPDGINEVTPPDNFSESFVLNLYDSNLADFLAASTTPLPFRSFFIDGPSFDFILPSLPQGTYVLQAVPLTGAGFTLQGVVPGLDGSALDPSTGLVELVLDAAGIDDVGIGFLDSGSASGFVWEDLNFDGILDEGENFLEGLTILIGREDDPSFSVTTQTDFLGRWSVEGLVLSSDYFVLVGDPLEQTSLKVSPIGIGFDNKADIDGRINFSLVSGNAINLNAGLSEVTNSLTGTVFEDVDGDGIFDGIESGLENVTVSIVGDSGIVASTTTNISGFFSFSNIHPGLYQLVIDDQVGSEFYLFTEGPDAQADENGEIQFFIRHLDTPDFSIGLIKTEIVATVFEDANANGIFDVSEAAASGITVNILDGSTVVATDVTDAFGVVSFQGLESKMYTFQVIPPSGASFTLQNVGALEARDSDVDPVTGEAEFILNQFSDTLSAGLIFPRDLSGTVFQDDNADEMQQVSEADLSNVILTLKRTGDSTFAITVTTDSSGLFSFNDLIPFSDYYLEINTTTVPFIIVNSTVIPVPTLTADTTGFDIGLVPDTTAAALFDISGFAWEESSPIDNVFMSGETLVEGVRINLYEMTESEYLALKAGGDLPAPFKTVATDSSGVFSFMSLLSKDYVLEVIKPPGKTLAEQDIGGDDTIDSDVDVDTEIIALNLSGTVNNLGIGLIDQPVRVQGTVFHDADGNNMFDTGEAPISGVLVEFFDSDGVFVGFTSTNQDGVYSFVFEEDFTGTALFTPIGPVATFSGTGAIGVDTAGASDPFTILLTQTSPTLLDVALTYDNSVSGTVSDASSMGIEGVEVQLIGEDGAVVATTATDATGDYAFTNIRPNQGYLVMIGTVDTLSNNYHITGGDIDDKGKALIFIGPDSTPSVDATLQINEISGFVFDDVNSNGIQDMGEGGVSGTTLVLSNTGGTVGMITTGSDGLFSFTGIENGDYTLTATLPSGNVFTFQDVGGDDTLDSDVDAITGAFDFSLKNTFTTIGVGSVATTFDISGTIWQDITGGTAGVIDMGEPTYDNVVVELWRIGDTTPFMTTTSSGGGIYAFDDVIPQSDYFIVINRDGNVPIDFNESASTAVFTLAADAVFDFPLTAITGTTFSLSGFAWVEEYSDFFGSTLDGVFDSMDDATLEGVRLFLYDTDLAGFDPSDSPFRTTLTDSNGDYTFGPFVNTTGPYVLQVITPEGKAFTVAGSDHNVNTDGRVELSDASPTANIGFIQLQSVSGTVWFDENSDGILDANEELLEGVEVTITADDDSLVTFTTTTDVNGVYTFADLVRGDYTVSIVKPSFASNFTQTGGDSLADSTGDISVTLGSFDLIDSDAGVANVYTISGTAFIDNYNDLASTGPDRPDGIYDSLSESVLEGLVVELYALTSATFLDDLQENNLLASTTTDALGNYTFADLDPGTYLVVPRVQGEYIFTFDHQGSDPTVDSNIGFYSGFGVIIIPEGQKDTTVEDFDIGLLETVSAGGTVWNDFNNDGILDPNETGLEGAQILVKNPFGGFWYVTESNFVGAYQFNTLPLAESYEARVILPDLTGELLGFSPTGSGLDNKADGQGIITFDLVRDSVLGPLDNFELDAGVVRLFTVSGFAWIDDYNDFFLDPGDGIFDSLSEGMLEGAVVTLYSADNPFIPFIKLDSNLATATTDSSGFFEIAGLLPGDYIAEVILPNGYIFTLTNQGVDEDLDSEINPNPLSGSFQETGRSDTFSVGETSTVIDNFGIGALEAYTVGDMVFADRNANGIYEPAIDFIDTNGNGIQDGMEPSNFEGIQLYFVAPDGGVALNTVSTTSGYNFFNIPKGTYYLDVFLEGDLEASPPGEGTDEALDSDFDPDNPGTILFFIDQDRDDIDVGVLPEVALQVTAFEDLNGNSVYDVGIDTLLEGVQVRLMQGETTLQIQTTNEDGIAFFNPVPGGSYTYEVLFDTDDFTLVLPDQGGDDSIDSDFMIEAPGLATYAFNNLPSETVNVAIGFSQIGTISGIVWSDIDADGFRQLAEPRFEDILVELFTESDLINPIASTMTDINGAYTFDAIPTGTYVVRVGLPASTGFTFTFPNIVTDSNDSDVNTPSGESDPFFLNGNTVLIDAGIVPTYTQEGFIWQDLNYNNQFDAGEEAEGIDVFAIGTGVIFETVTDANGIFTFDSLIQGIYDIGVAPPDNFRFMRLSDDFEGFNAVGLANNVAVGDGITPEVLIAGIGEVAFVGDLVFLDENGNGLFDDGEAGIEDVLVQSTFTNSALAGYQFSVFSESDGSWLLPVFLTEFNLQMTVPSGYTFTDQNVGIDETIDSDFDASGSFGPATITQDNFDIDAGLRTSHDISGTAWVDSDVDGILDASEALLEFVDVSLFQVHDDLSTTLIETTPTDSLGNYAFTDILNGNYFIVADLSATPYSSFTIQGGDSVVDATGTSATFLIAGLNNDITGFDIGARPVVLIGDFVFLDVNGNGIQDVGEEGVEGVTVNLYSISDQVNPISTVLTDSEGGYFFTDVATGSYFVEFDVSAFLNIFGDPLYQFTLRNQGTDDAIDSDPDPATGRTSIFFVSDGFETVDLDAGLRTLHTIQGTFFYDRNGNGLFDDSGDEVEGIILELIRGDGTTTGLVDSTDANGLYSFSGVEAGTYFVRALSLTAGSVPYVLGTGLDTDFSPDTLQTGTVNLDATGEFAVFDGALRTLHGVSGFVFEDTNGDGLQDIGEPGFEGAAVNIRDAEGLLINTAVTDINGNYAFSGILNGTYFLEIDPAVLTSFGKQLTVKGDGSQPAIDSDFDPATFESDPFILQLGGITPDLDAGLVNLDLIRGIAWYDANGDGLRGVSEEGVEGVLATLFFSDGTSTGLTALTDENGFYTFADISAGNYFVEIDLTGITATNYLLGVKGDGTNPDFDSDIDPLTSQSDVFTIASNSGGAVIDVGLRSLHDITGTAFYDLDGDAVFDMGVESVLEGIEVELLFSDGTTTGQTTLTDSQGIYTFTDLINGSYLIRLNTFSSGGNTYVVGPGGAFNLATATTGEVQVTAPQNEEIVDAPFRTLHSVGDFVFLDADGDGIQDPGEIGVEGAIVNLIDPDTGLAIDGVVTDSQGNYLITDILNGTYRIQVFLPDENLGFTQAFAGADPSLDSNVDSNGISDLFTLSLANPQDLTIDAGVIQLFSIGDFVFLDLNENGIQDIDESGVAGITLRLFNGIGDEIGIAITDANGFYSFDDLFPGDYFIRAELGNLPFTFTVQDAGSDDTLDSDVDANGETDIFTLSGDDFTRDIGLVPFSGVTGVIFRDLDRDGIQDIGDTGLEGVLVNLRDENDQLIDSILTDASGRYFFAAQETGLQYYIEVVEGTGPGFGFTLQDQGLNDIIDSDVDPVTGQTALFTFDPDDTLVFDAGFIYGVTVGDRVWNDSDGDGIQDGGEPGLSGVTVTLKDSGGNILGQVVTDSMGTYLFENVLQGAYFLEFMTPSGAIITQQGAGVDPELDSDINALGQTDLFTVTGPGDRFDLDAGYRLLYQIGDRVWSDLNGNGIQDMGELGVAGVEVTLFDVLGGVIDQTVTDANGNYFFDVLNGDYFLRFNLPPEYFAFAPKDQGGDDALDSDVFANGETDVFTIFENNNFTLDAGLLLPLGSVEGTVFEDVNLNGNNNGEPLLGGLTVRLLDTEGNEVAQTTTDSNGFYVFNAVLQGDYLIVVETSGFLTNRDDLDGIGNNGELIQQVSLDSSVPEVVNFGVAQPGSVEGEAWIDADRDGVRDPGEAPFEGVLVNLFNADGILIGQTVTNANGIYQFNGLNPLEDGYTLDFQNVPNFTFTLQDQGGDDTVDSDVSFPDGRVSFSFDASGETISDVDAGYIPGETPPNNVAGFGEGSLLKAAQALKGHGDYDPYQFEHQQVEPKKTDLPDVKRFSLFDTILRFFNP